MADNNFPVLIPHPELLMPFSFSGEMAIGGIWGSVKAGETWMSMQGERFIWYVDGMQVVYSISEKFYTQSAAGFKGDIRTYPLAAAGVSARPWVVVAETEMKLLMGIVAGASGAGFVAVVGLEVAEFVTENAGEFSKWESQLEEVWKVRTMLKDKAPVLYDKVFSAVLKQVWKDTKSNLPDAVTPQIIFFGIGVIIGAAGKAATAGKLSVLGILVVVLEQLAVRFTLGVAPGAIKITSDEYKTMSKQIIEQLKTAGVAVQDGDVQKIAEEVRSNPQLIKDALKRLQEALQSAPATKQQAAGN